MIAADGTARRARIVGLEIAAEQWPPDVMCRLLLPVPVRELAVIASALGALAKNDGKEARMRQVGNVLEIFTVTNAEVREPRHE